ncbi:MAG: LPS export ABC transporter permease LptG [Alphaproteobacteria bacterium]
MKISPTLSRYLARTYVINTLFLLLALLGVIYLFDTVELMRRAGKIGGIPLSIILKMGLLKLPEVGQMLLPFAILFGAMFTFWQMTRRYELIVVRAAGFSFWQFLAPIVGVALVIGLLHITIINPLGALLLGRFQQMENTYLTRQDNQIALFKEGLWLRQATSGNEDGYVILHAAKIEHPSWKLRNVMALFFTKDDQFVKRLDADMATLEEGEWLFQDTVVTSPDTKPVKESVYILPTGLTVADIEESFSSAAAMSFWKLPGHIRTLEETGFDASPLKVYYQNLLSQPLMFAAMVLLAAAVSMRPPRSKGVLNYFVAGIFIGFVIFFMSSFLQALGASQQVPVVLAAWSPALISLLLGLSVMMNLEDG